MRAISFAWTTPALVAGRKTVTRRDWSDRYAASFRAGEFVAAWNRQPRFRGARQVAVIRLTAAPAKESTVRIPTDDWEGEGFAYLEEIGARVDGLTPRALWTAWRVQPREMWVVRFEVVSLVEAQPGLPLP